MTRRTRIRLLAVLILLGLPLLVCAGLVWFVGSGGLERRIASEYAARLPGRLAVKRVELDGTRHAIVHGISLYGPDGGDAIVTVDHADIRGQLFPPRIEAIELHGVKVRFDRDGVAFLREALARPQPPASGQRSAVRVHLDGSVHIAQRLHLEGLVIDAAIAGGAVDGRVRGTLGGAPLELTITPEDGAVGAHPPLGIVLTQARIGLADLFAALTGLGLMPEQDQLLPWLPAEADLAGTSLRAVPQARVLTGTSRPTWAGGHAEATITMDAAGLRLPRMVVRDDRLGSAEGTLAVAFDTRVLTVAVERWTPGPKLPIPAQIPVADLLRLLPAARATVVPQGPRITITCLPGLDAQPVTAPRAEIRWSRGPLVVEAAHLPLPLARRFVPEAVLPTGGTITRLLVEWEGSLQRLGASIAKAEVAIDKWTLHDLDIELDAVALDPHDPAAGFAIHADLPMASVVHRGDQLTITIARLDDLVAHVTAPAPLPRLRGLIKVTSEVIRSDEGWKGRIQHLGVAGLASDLSLRDLAAAAKGQFIWADRRLEVQLTGQLVSGELGLPNGWLDLSARTPIFTTTFSIQPGRVELHEALARAADRFGQPAKDGFTAELRGRADPDLTGSLTGVIDHADIGWLKRNSILVPLPSSAEVVGEGAVTFTLRSTDGVVAGVDGYVLPLNVDLTLLDGKLDISGITGALHFSLVRPSAAPVPAPKP